MSVQPIELEELEKFDKKGDPLLKTNLDLIKKVKVKLDVIVGETDISVGELFNLKQGSVLKLNSDVSAPLDIVLNGEIIGRGELVVVDDNFGIRISNIKN